MADRDVVEVAVTAVKWMDSPLTPSRGGGGSSGGGASGGGRSGGRGFDPEFSSDVLRGESVGQFKRPLSSHFPLQMPAKNSGNQHVSTSSYQLISFGAFLSLQKKKQCNHSCHYAYYKFERAF